MRFDDNITFHSISGEIYNTDTGEYETGTDIKTVVRANVTDLGTNQTMQLFGALNQNIKVIRLSGSVPESWNYLTINDGNIKYTLKTYKQLLKGQTLIVGENDG